MATATPPAPSLGLGDQAKSLQTLRRAAQIAAGVLILLGVVKAVTSVLTLPGAPLLALLGAVEGAVILFLSLILLKIATDLRYAQDVPPLAGMHLVNALDSWCDFCKTLIALAVVAFLTALVRFGI